MAEKIVAVLDVGSSSITACIAERGVNNTLRIRGTGTAAYSGFSEGEFFSLQDLKLAVALAISNAQATAGMNIQCLYVSVPGEFSLCECKLVSQTYPKRIKIKEKHITALSAKTRNNAVSQNFSILSLSPIYYILDDNRKVTDVVDEKTSRLTGYFSNTYVDNKFVELMNEILKESNVQMVEYVAGTLATALHLLDEEVRNQPVVLIDCGYITTSLLLIQGNGLLQLNTFSIGGGHISADLAEYLNLSFSEASALKKKILLSVQPKGKECYEVQSENQIVPIPILVANEIVAARLDMIAMLIKKCLLQYQRGSEYLPIYLTGGGISYMKGAKDYISKCIGRNITLAAPYSPQLNEPNNSSLYGLIEFALSKNSFAKKQKFR